MSNRITVTQDAPTNTSNHIDKGTDSYFERLKIPNGAHFRKPVKG